MERGRNNRRPRGQARKLNCTIEASSVIPQEGAQNCPESDLTKDLINELKEARIEVTRQKNMKEMFINKEKGLRDKLERLERACDPETRIAEKDYEDHQKFSAELQLEREKNAALQQELEQLKLKHQLNLSNEDELKVECRKMSEYLEATKQLMAEKDTLIHQMKEEIKTLQKNASEKQKTFFKDLEDLKDEQVLNKQELVTKLQAEGKVGQDLRTELSQLKEEHQDKIREQEKEKEALEKDVELEAEREKSDSLQKQLEREREEFKYSQNDPCRPQHFFIRCVEDNTSEKEKTCLKEKQASTNQEQVTKLQAEEKVRQGLQTELSQLQEEHQDKIREQEQEKEALEKDVELEAEREKSDSLQKQLEREREEFKYSQNDPCRPQHFFIRCVEDNTSEKEKTCLKEKQASTNQEQVTKLQAEEKVRQGLQTELSQLQEEHQDKIREQEQEKEALEKDVELEAEREKSDSLQKQLERETPSKAEKAKESLEAIKQLMAVKKSLEEEIKTLKDNTSEKEKTYHKEKQASTNQEQVTKLQAEEVSQGLRTELDTVKETQDKTRKQKKYVLPDSPEIQVLEYPEVKKTRQQKTKKLSAWKKFKRAMGLPWV